MQKSKDKIPKQTLTILEVKLNMKTPKKYQDNLKNELHTS